MAQHVRRGGAVTGRQRVDWISRSTPIGLVDCSSKRAICAGLRFGQHREGQGEARLVMALEVGRIERERLLQPLADLRHHVAGHLVARLSAAAGLCASAVKMNCLRSSLVSLRFSCFSSSCLLLLQFGAGAGDLLRIGRVERLAQFFEIQAHVVGGPVLRQRDAVAVQNLAAHRRNAHGAEGLGFEVRLVIPRRDHLHPPQPGQQHAQAGQHDHRDQPQLRVVSS